MRRTRLKRLLLCTACATLLIALALFWACLPQPLFDRPYSRVLLDRNNLLLGASIAKDEQWRFPPMERVPEKFSRALILYEDKRFRSHPGVDPLAVARALWLNLKEGRVVSGASTLTMQVIRLSRNGRPRTLAEKLIEAFLALRLELSADKEEILGLFAAHAPFGGNVVGLEAAAWRYFGRRPDQLSWAENALLAVLPNSPALIHPGRNRSLLLEKRNALLDLLAREGIIDSLTLRLSKAEPLPDRPCPIPQLSPHLLARVRSSPHFRDKGPRFHTTLDKALQVQTLQVLTRHHGRLSQNGIYNAAAIILDTRTNKVRAYVGNVGDFNEGRHGNQVDLITSMRSTGSILKPLLYAALLDAGELLPQQLVPDIPSHWGGFSPQNYNLEYQGAVPADQALARSLNVPAAHMLARYGVDRFHDFLKSLGMTTLFREPRDYGLSLILGGAEGTLWEIAGIYAGLGRAARAHSSPWHEGGSFPFFDPLLFDAREIRAKSPSRPPVSPGPGWLTLEAMTHLTRPGIESALEIIGTSGRLAWKTGTSYGLRDAWSVGVTQGFTIGVWAGNADGEGRPELTGIKAAAPILFDLFGLLGNSPWFEQPQGELVEVEVCAFSGHRKSPHCPRTRCALVPPSGLKTGPCPYCRTIHLDPDTGLRADSTCVPIQELIAEKRFSLPPTMSWFYQRYHADFQPPPPFMDECRHASTLPEKPSLSLLYPGRNSSIYVPRELDGRTGRAVFEAAHCNDKARVFWHLDQKYLGFTRDIHQMAVAPEPGPHTITLVDDTGEMLSTRFTIIAKTRPPAPAP